MPRKKCAEPRARAARRRRSRCGTGRPGRRAACRRPACRRACAAAAGRRPGPPAVQRLAVGDRDLLGPVEDGALAVGVRPLLGAVVDLLEDPRHARARTSAGTPGRSATRFLTSARWPSGDARACTTPIWISRANECASGRNSSVDAPWWNRSAQRRDRVGDVGEHVAVGQHAALGPAGGAAGVDDGGDVVGGRGAARSSISAASTVAPRSREQVEVAGVDLPHVGQVRQVGADAGDQQRVGVGLDEAGDRAGVREDPARPARRWRSRRPGTVTAPTAQIA